MLNAKTISTREPRSNSSSSAEPWYLHISDKLEYEPVCPDVPAHFVNSFPKDGSPVPFVSEHDDDDRFNPFTHLFTINEKDACDFTGREKSSWLNRLGTTYVPVAWKRQNDAREIKKFLNFPEFVPRIQEKYDRSVISNTIGAIISRIDLRERERIYIFESFGNLLARKIDTKIQEQTDRERIAVFVHKTMCEFEKKRDFELSEIVGDVQSSLETKINKALEKKGDQDTSSMFVNHVMTEYAKRKDLELQTIAQFVQGEITSELFRVIEEKNIRDLIGRYMDKTILNINERNYVRELSDDIVTGVMGHVRICEIVESMTVRVTERVIMFGIKNALSDLESDIQDRVDRVEIGRISGLMFDSVIEKIIRTEISCILNQEIIPAVIRQHEDQEKIRIEMEKMVEAIKRKRKRQKEIRAIKKRFQMFPKGSSRNLLSAKRVGKIWRKAVMPLKSRRNIWESQKFVNALEAESQMPLEPDIPSKFEFTLLEEFVARGEISDMISCMVESVQYRIDMDDILKKYKDLPNGFRKRTKSQIQLVGTDRRGSLVIVNGGVKAIELDEHVPDESDFFEHHEMEMGMVDPEKMFRGNIAAIVDRMFVDIDHRVSVEEIKMRFRSINKGSFSNLNDLKGFAKFKKATSKRNLLENMKFVDGKGKTMPVEREIGKDNTPKRAKFQRVRKAAWVKPTPEKTNIVETSENAKPIDSKENERENVDQETFGCNLDNLLNHSRISSGYGSLAPSDDEDDYESDDSGVFEGNKPQDISFDLVNAIENIEPCKVEVNDADKPSSIGKDDSNSVDLSSDAIGSMDTKYLDAGAREMHVEKGSVMQSLHFEARGIEPDRKLCKHCSSNIPDVQTEDAEESLEMKLIHVVDKFLSREATKKNTKPIFGRRNLENDNKGNEEDVQGASDVDPFIEQQLLDVASELASEEPVLENDDSDSDDVDDEKTPPQQSYVEDRLHDVVKVLSSEQQRGKGHGKGKGGADVSIVVKPSTRDPVKFSNRVNGKDSPAENRGLYKEMFSSMFMIRPPFTPQNSSTRLIDMATAATDNKKKKDSPEDNGEKKWAVKPHPFTPLNSSANLNDGIANMKKFQLQKSILTNLEFAARQTEKDKPTTSPPPKLKPIKVFTRPAFTPQNSMASLPFPKSVSVATAEKEVGNDDLSPSPPPPLRQKVFRRPNLTPQNSMASLPSPKSFEKQIFANLQQVPFEIQRNIDDPSTSDEPPQNKNKNKNQKKRIKMAFRRPILTPQNSTASFNMKVPNNTPCTPGVTPKIMFGVSPLTPRSSRNSSSRFAPLSVHQTRHEAGYSKRFDLVEDEDIGNPMSLERAVTSLLGAVDEDERDGFDIDEDDDDEEEEEEGDEYDADCDESGEDESKEESDEEYYDIDEFQRYDDDGCVEVQPGTVDEEMLMELVAKSSTKVSGLKIVPPAYEKRVVRELDDGSETMRFVKHEQVPVESGFSRDQMVDLQRELHLLAKEREREAREIDFVVKQIVPNRVLSHTERFLERMDLFEREVMSKKVPVKKLEPLHKLKREFQSMNDVFQLLREKNRAKKVVRKSRTGSLNPKEFKKKVGMFSTLLSKNTIVHKDAKKIDDKIVEIENIQTTPKPKPKPTSNEKKKKGRTKLTFPKTYVQKTTLLRRSKSGRNVQCGEFVRTTNLIRREKVNADVSSSISNLLDDLDRSYRVYQKDLVKHGEYIWNLCCDNTL